MFGFRSHTDLSQTRIASALMGMEMCHSRVTACLIGARIVDGVRVQAAFLADQAHQYLSVEEAPAAFERKLASR